MEETQDLPVGVHAWSDERNPDESIVRTFAGHVTKLGLPHHLAKCDHGVYQLSVDVLDRPDLRDGDGGADPEKRPAYRAAGQQLAFMMTALDQELAEIETGRLIRMVCHTEQGALFCMAVTPKNYVLGIVFGPATEPQEGHTALPRVPLVRATDRHIAGLVGELRDRIGLPTLNHGGWQSRDRALPPTAPPPGFLSAAHRSGRESALDDRFARALDPKELVYVSRSRGGEVVEEVDILDHEFVAEGRSDFISARAAREFYRRISGEFGTYARQLGLTAQQAVNGRMLRIVLDVEQGAIYYYRLGPGDYLVGVTINQKRVSEADDVLGRLAAGILADGIH